MCFWKASKTVFDAFQTQIFACLCDATDGGMAVMVDGGGVRVDFDANLTLWPQTFFPFYNSLAALSLSILSFLLSTCIRLNTDECTIGNHKKKRVILFLNASNNNNEKLRPTKSHSISLHPSNLRCVFFYFTNRRKTKDERFLLQYFILVLFSWLFDGF